jgi:hypothetical protein
MAVVDSLWAGPVKSALLKRFPQATDAELTEARAYAYGGCLIQDLGYYPFGDRFFSDLLHYVRSADLIQALVDESTTLDEYAFSLGAVIHYGSDVEGHSIAINRVVPMLYPKLKARYGDIVTYADDRAAHLKTEFAFDVLQVARGHYAPQTYHDLIGFNVSKELIQRAFEKTYGLPLEVEYHHLDLSINTFRYSVSELLPEMTRAAWVSKKKEIEKLDPKASRSVFVYNMRRAEFNKQYGSNYQRPGPGARFIAFVFRVIPKVGPFKGLAFKVPPPAAQDLFEASFDAAIKRNERSLAMANGASLHLANRDLDTGHTTSPGEYAFTDKTYDALILKLSKRNFAGVSPELRQNILTFYASMKGPDPHGVQPLVDAIKATDH